MARHIAGLPRSGIRDFFELVNAMSGDVISLGIGEPDFATPWRIREAAIYALDQGRTSYTSNLGLMELRRAICAYVEERFDVRYDPGRECIVTVGVSEALDLALRALLNPGEEVLYHEPCYVSYAPGIAMAHAVPVPVVTHAETGFTLDPAAVARQVTPRTKVLLLNYPNNPTGAALDLAQKAALAEVAVRHDLVVISDEIYEELTYGPRCCSLAAFPGMKERTLVLNGFSKSFAMTGLRIGFACGPAELIDAMMKIHQYTMLCASSLSQAAAVEALRHAEREKEEMRTEYEQRRNVLVRRLNDMGLPCFLPQGAFYAFPSIAGTGLASAEFAQRLLHEQRVAVVPGSAFGASGEGHVRCAYATAMAEIETAMVRMEVFVRGLLQTRRRRGRPRLT